MDNKRYKLEIEIKVNECDERGFAIYNQGLRVSDAMDLGALDFAGVCGVLGQMHAAIKKISKVAEPDKHFDPHLGPNGYCVCDCDECKPPEGYGCQCVKCRCYTNVRAVHNED